MQRARGAASHARTADAARRMGGATRHLLTRGGGSLLEAAFGGSSSPRQPARSPDDLAGTQAQKSAVPLSRRPKNGWCSCCWLRCRARGCLRRRFLLLLVVKRWLCCTCVRNGNRQGPRCHLCMKGAGSEQELGRVAGSRAVKLEGRLGAAVGGWQACEARDARSARDNVTAERPIASCAQRSLRRPGASASSLSPQGNEVPGREGAPAVEQEVRSVADDFGRVDVRAHAVVIEVSPAPRPSRSSRT